MRPVDNTIIFSPIDFNQVLQPHEDALILTLGVGGFDMRRILDDLSSSTDFMQMSTNNPTLGSLACKGINKIYT